MFTSRVTLKPPKHEILVEYVDGPFRYLHNHWRFEPAPQSDDSAAAHFHIDYAFKSPLLGMLVGTMFDRAFRRFLVAFEQRANAVYRPPAGTMAPVTI